MSDRVTLAHGFGGRRTQELLDNVILPALRGEGGHEVTLDAAVLPPMKGNAVISTDSFTVKPLFFPGGDIGKLAACGTINDVAMMGARPLYMTLALVIEEGFAVSDIVRIITSLGAVCRETRVKVVTGDTKVVEKGSLDGIIVNTTGVGERIYEVGPEKIREGDAIIISGTIADHGAAILNARENLGFKGSLDSDCAPLWSLVETAAKIAGGDLHALRDPTRGGLAATLNEFAADTGLNYVILENAIPIRPVVRTFLEIVGMDPLPVANEGKAIMFVAESKAEKTISALRNHDLGRDAAIIGRVEKSGRRGKVIMETAIGTSRVIEMPLEAGLPRIC